MREKPFCESQIQAVLMDWILEDKKHQMALPNTKSVYPWECDMLSLTKAGYIHEYEIKRTKADFRADFTQKRGKHQILGNKEFHTWRNSSIVRVPNYFWYVTHELEIQPPEYAGWMTLTQGHLDRWIMYVEKPAPRLHTQKISDKQRLTMQRGITYRLKNLFVKRWHPVYSKE